MALTEHPESERYYIPTTRGCFACGTENQCGMQLQVYRWNRDMHFYCDTSLKSHMRGMSKTAHGGIVATLLDEVVGITAAQSSDKKCVTVELIVKFKKPVFIESLVRIEGWVDDIGEKIVRASGRIINPDGEELATVSGKFFALDMEKAQAFLNLKGMQNTEKLRE